MSREPEPRQSPTVSAAPPPADALVVRERDPRTARLMRSGRISEDGRHQKERGRAKTPRPWAAAPVLIAVGSVVAVAAVVAAAVFVLGGGSDDPGPAVAADLAAAYSVRATVTNTRGNTNFSVGQQTTFPVTLECAGSPCRLTSDEWPVVRYAGDTVTGNWTRSVTCPSDPGVAVDNTYDLSVHATKFETIDGRHVPTAFEGEETVGTVEGVCPRDEVRPVTYSIVVKRRG